MGGVEVQRRLPSRPWGRLTIPALAREGAVEAGMDGGVMRCRSVGGWEATRWTRATEAAIGRLLVLVLVAIWFIFVVVVGGGGGGTTLVGDRGQRSPTNIGEGLAGAETQRGNRYIGSFR